VPLRKYERNKPGQEGQDYPVQKAFMLVNLSPQTVDDTHQRQDAEAAASTAA